MNKVFFCSLFSIMAVLLLAQSTPLEARHHHCRSSHVQVGVGANMVARDAYVARRYVRPVVASRPVIVAQDPYCYSPVYAYAPAYAAPVYVEEVYVAPRPRPVTFGGLSFSFNLF